MNAKLVLALIAVAVVAVSAKPATRLENAVKEAALAFRDAANDAISKTAGKATSEVGNAEKAAMNLVGEATGAVTGGSSSGGGGIMAMFGGWWNSFLHLFGMGKPAVPSVGALGGAESMLNKIPGVGGELSSVEKAMSGATGGKLRRKRSPADTPAATVAGTGGDQKKPDGSDNKQGAVPEHGASASAPGHAGVAAIGNATANCTAPASGFGYILQLLGAPLRMLGLMHPVCPTVAISTAPPGAAVSAAAPGHNALVGNTNGDGKVDDKDKKPDSNTPVDNTKKARRKRSDLLASIEGELGGKGGAGGLAGVAGGMLGGKSGGLLGEAGGLLGAVTGTPCVLGWGEWLMSFFGMMPNRCTLAKSFGGLMG